MKLNTALTHISLGGVLLSLSVSLAHAQLTLPDVPLFVKDGVDPNMIVTLDDSGSMAWAYVPDSISDTNRTRRFRSAHFNAMYYNPEIVYVPPRNAAGNAYTTSFTAAYEHGMIPAKGTRNLANNYIVTRSYNPADVPQVTGHPAADFSNTTAGTAAYYYVFDSSRSGCNGTKGDDDCYRKVTVGATGNRVAASTYPGGYDVNGDGTINGDDERQNFANWYSFYRTRVLATASAAALSFQSVGSNIRVAFQNLHKCKGFSTSCLDHRNNGSFSYDSRVRPFTGSHRDKFFDWLAYSPASGGTPLRTAVMRAGSLLQDTSINSPYAKDPGTTKDPMYECRPSFHVVMTDGIWNSDNITSIGNADNTAFTTPGGCPGTLAAGCEGYQRRYGPMSYTARTPFRDGTGNTLADIVFKQWATDAQPNIPNQVPTYIRAANANESSEYWDPRNDPAEWQHMTTFLVSFGLEGFLSGSATKPTWGGSTFAGEYSKVLDGTKSWPAVAADDANNPYDLWHAAINGRGDFFSAEDPNTLVSAFNAIIAGINQRQASAASVAMDSGVVSGLNYAYHASFSSNGWTGELKAYELVPPRYEPAATPTWNASSLLNSRLPGSRTIKVANSSGVLVDFAWNNLDASVQNSLNIGPAGSADGKGVDRVAYLRGDRSKENLTTGFRPRNGLLGDIIHSSPTYVGAPKRVGMDKLEGLSASAANSYANFTSSRAARTPLIYVGANDGMLHAFNAATGAETFAFVPSAVLPDLRHLTYNGYSHRFYVDGPTTSGDVFDGSQWRTILVGTLRSGGKSVFALDVTDPSNIALLWEYSDADLGHVYGRPAIVRLHNGTWGVVFGNGYNSTNQQAVLYVLNATTGALMSKLNTGRGDAANPNGLASASPMDINGDLVVDYVYAGDLHGNLWRFDLLDTSNANALRGTASVPARNNSPANTWRIGYGGAPLFAAKDAASPANRQPITTNIVAAPHQTGTGIMVMFGTGKYLEASDAQQNTALTQTYYGIWDRYVLGESTTSAFLSPTIDRSRLQQQTLSSQTSETFVRDENGTPVNVLQTVRTVSNNAVNWYDYSTNPVTRSKDGWYIDFRENGVNLGEMLVTDSLLIGNNVVFATTTPSSDPCKAGVERWIWSLDVQTGGRTDTPAFDLNNDGVIDDFDKTSTGNINNSVRVEGFGAPSAVGERIYLNLDDTIQTELVGLGGNNIRRSWRVIR